MAREPDRRDWPAFPPTDPPPVELAKILFQAQVDEAAKQRGHEPSQPDEAPAPPAGWPAYPSSNTTYKDLVKAAYDEVLAAERRRRTAAEPAPAAPEGLPPYPRLADGYEDLAKAAYDEALAIVRRERTSQESPPPAPEGLPAYPQLADGYEDLAKAAYDALVRNETAAADRGAALAKLREETDVALTRAYHETVRDTAKAALSRADGLPQLVIGSAGAIVTLYTGLLGLVFAAGGDALPTRALIPALYLGAAITLATGYAAYLTRRSPTVFDTADSVWANAIAHTNGFIDWIDRAIRQRGVLLRASVIALGVGIFFLPAAFVDLREPVTSSSVAAPSLEPWPTAVAADPGGQAALDQVLFEAQVAEAAAVREAMRLSTQSVNSVELAWSSPLGTHRTPVVELAAWLLAIVVAGMLLLYVVVSSILNRNEATNSQTSTSTV